MSNCGLSAGCLPKPMRLVSSRLTAAIPKARGGQPYHKSTIDNVVDSRKSEALKESGIKYDVIDNDVEFSKPKSEALREIGIQQKQAERYERLARVADISRRCLPKS